MMVLDASAILELLLGTERGSRVASAIARAGVALLAPHLVDLEVAQVLRRLVVKGDLTTTRAEQALADLDALGLERHAHADLIPRIWSLRSNLTAYDAAYVALAEVMDATLVTCDAKLAASSGHRARVLAV